MRIAILGAGAWGTALAIALSRQHHIMLWSHNALHAGALDDTRLNPYLSDVLLPGTVSVRADMLPVLRDAELVIIATPLNAMREMLQIIAQHRADVPLLWACKGMESGTQKLPHQILADELKSNTQCGAITGPSFALEVALGQPTALVLASHNLEWACTTAAQLNDFRLRIYANDDVVGAEIGGAVKNVLAIATGICDGLEFGLNARAALITRGLAEMARLAEHMGARRETLMGLTGMGDLILTCTGELSRNRRVGLALAEGKKLDDVLYKLGHVAEGVSTAHEVQKLAHAQGVDMPIVEAVCAILNGQIKPAAAVELLLARDPKVE